MRRIAVCTVLLFVCSMSGQPAQPSNAQGWYEQGLKLEQSGDYAGALAAYLKARELKFAARPVISLRIAGAYAQTGEREKALTLLEQMANNGFGPASQILAEDELLSVRSDPRFKKVVAQMNRNAHPCTLTPEYRQFDYWLGEWDVEIAGQKLARSSIQLILDECVIFENYTDSRGYAGKSFSIYDANTKKWEQRYVDTTGAFHTWTGGLESGRMVFYWKTPQGLQRMTYEKDGSDRVRQLIDSSNDEGKTWTPGYNGVYVRRK